MSVNRYRLAPGAIRTMEEMDTAAQVSGLESDLIELVKIRAAQVNGCAYCVQMHSSEARDRGETAQRIADLANWRDSALFTARERGALAWTDAVMPAAGGVDDAALHTAGEHFDEEALVRLTLVALAVDAWHRIAICFRHVQPANAGNAAA